MNETINRRKFLTTTSLSAAGIMLPVDRYKSSPYEKKTGNNPAKAKICAFTKLFQFLDYDQLSTLYAEAGLDGFDLTVRQGGHVEPERVKTDLPKAVTAARKNGLEVYMMTTAITNADDQMHQVVLKTAADLGIVYYRLGYLYYDKSKSMPENLDFARKILEKLAALNEKINIHGAYQNHIQQSRIGSPVWDLWYILKDIDPVWMSCQYDIWHAVIEGYSSWENGLRLLSPYIKTRCIKDFNWMIRDGKITPVPVPLGEGQIDFDAYFKLLNELDLKGDTTLHIEYPVLTGEDVNLPMKNKIDKALSILKRDNDTLKYYMAKNNDVL